MWSRLVDQVQLSHVADEACTAEMRAPQPASSMATSQIEENTAFSLWQLREGNASDLVGEARTAQWLEARPQYQAEASILLRMMDRCGLRVGAKNEQQ